MSKIRLHIEPSQIKNLIKVEGKDAIHKIKDVLRLKVDNEVYIFDGRGKEYLYQLKEISKKSITFKQKSLERDEEAPQKRLTLGFPLVREERIDFILQKATELGVAEFIPFICERSIQKNPSQSKVERWRRIIIEAARQCERLWLPTLSDVLDFKKVLLLSDKVKLVGSIDGQRIDKDLIKQVDDVFFIIGPVGDFTEAEYDQLRKSGFKSLKLANHILRTETAAVLGVGLINYFL